MSGFKPIFFKLISPIAYTLNLQTLLKLSNLPIALPLYHCITEVPPAHLKYLYTTRNIKSFQSDLEILLRNFQPVSLAELMLIAKENKKTPKPVFHLTFDDGLAEFDSVIAPILLKKGIPATCFLNSDFIDNKKLFFRFKASIIIDTLHHSATGSEIWKEFHLWKEDNALTDKYYRNNLLSIRYNEKNILDDLAQKLQLDFAEYLNKNKPYLEKKQIESLINKGFTFGAHSMDHPEYRFIDEKDQIEQTIKSIQDITAMFGLSYRVFSFPFTDHEVSGNFYNSIEKNVDLTFGCAGLKNDEIPYNLQRIPIENYNENISNILKKEYLYLKFLKILKKDLIKRVS